MIPGLLAQDVARALREFIITGFETDTWPFAGKFEQLVNTHGTSLHEQGEAFIKGPYVSLSLPFAKNTERKDFFTGFNTEHSPFAHQQQAWSNLRSSGRPSSTLVATGTGSGKTECFLYPLLDHCLRNPKPGVKAIVIYPMNALAGDQAKRFAEVIHVTPELKGKVRVGLFVGGASDEKFMGEKHVITCKNTLRKSPPDILLTNYKMLDFLLMRPRDQLLWQHNRQDTLQYLVVDELHTFDGAQGSDLAMLIRRLKARLGVKTEQLICAGTSATLGSEAQMDDLAHYASNIFDTGFNRNSIIGESRESHDQFLGMIEHMMLDPSFSIAQLYPDYYPSLDAYLIAQAKLFFGDDWVLAPQEMASRQALGEHLRKHLLMHNLLKASSQGPAPLKALLGAIKKIIPPQLEPKNDESVTLVLLSFLSLISHARGRRYPGEPFITVRLQLWARELRRIVARVGTNTAQNPVYLQFSDDLKARAKNEKYGDIYLPAVQCTECHTTAWLTALEQGEAHIEQDLRKIYTRFFANDKHVRVLLPLQTPEHKPQTKGVVKHLCTHCGHLQFSGERCGSCNEEALVTVFEPDLNKSVRRAGVPTFESQRQCPVCQASNSLLLFGARAASLSAVAIHQLFANKINDDKKLIAFSDSVQDAAHRAGFFAARTWQNNIRMAIAKVVTHYCNTQQQAIALTDLFVYLPNFWLHDTNNAERLDEVSFITEFIPPNMQHNHDYLALKEQNSLENPGKLIGQINKRLAWEILCEFGSKSLVGRSLERTGVAAVYWNPQLINDAAHILGDAAREHLGYSLPEKSACYLLWGIALRMKRQGAMYNEDLFRVYLEAGGDYFYLSKKNKSFMPDLGSYSIIPRFPGEAAEKGLDRLIPKQQSTWYSRWVQQYLAGDQLVDNHFISDLLKLAMQSLVEVGLLLTFYTRKEHKAWALNPLHLSITNELAALRLRRGDLAEPQDNGAYGSWYLPKAWVEHVSGMFSLDLASGKSQSGAIYEPNAHPRRTMFHDFYVNGEIKRVIGHEHTALLERGYREALEQRFMEKAGKRKDWYENLLSATPTLEMGIDIGDLSSVLLCSVPPSQANYLQRAGRGGRKDGNSFVLTLANGHPHDLYFYADPLKMLAGNVQAPAIFLNASMVLRRQLLAFCFDQWGLRLQGQHVIPGSMQTVLDAVENADLKRFPHTLLEFIGKHRDELWEMFNTLLDQDVLPDTRLKLKAYLLGTTTEEEDSLRVYVITRIKQVVEERKSLLVNQQSLEAELRSLSKKPKDEARDILEQELTTELEGIKRLKRDLNQKDTLNFLTDDGLLPNYAFPEEGTTLRSVIFRRLNQAIELADGKTTHYDSKIFEYSRPAHAALSELAPQSIFYASNRKVKIERIEMSRGENLEYWRLCPSCSYSERIDGLEKNANCPRCGDPMWSNISQLMPMVKLRQVYANTKEDDAFIGDDSDTREPTFYNKQMLIDFDPVDIKHAYAMKTDTKPFGFEFIKKALFKEINFGKQGGNDQLLNVAGKEMARPGFKICKECGMVQNRRNQVEHLFKCSFRKEKNNSEETQDSNGIIDCLYLYRQYESEAVRILMPNLSLAESEMQIQSFVAAIQLGLKSRFGGKVDHINIMVSDEPIPSSVERASFLVLYDTVPGGTGYLHTLLADPKNLLGTLEQSRQIMADCDCQNSPDMDGCYNCLYAYKNSYGMENTSRIMALSMLNDILDENIELEEVEHLGKINKSTWSDSELESRFPEALQALHEHPQLSGARVRVTKDIVNGKVGFKLEVGKHIYSVEPHARLGKQEGVTYPCEPDFLISLDRDSGEKVAVAVFLDGYSYHKDIVHEDLMKRQGIFLGSGILTWSLTWHDVNHVFAGSEVKIPNALRENTANSPMAFIKKIAESKGLQGHSQIAELSPVVMLLKFLVEPDIDQWRSYAALRTLCWLDNDRMKNLEEKEKFNAQLKSLPSQYVDAVSENELMFFSSNNWVDKSLNMAMFIAGGQEAIKDLAAESIVLTTIYDPINTDDELTKIAWQKLLQILNIGQFLPKFFAGTRRGIEDGAFAQLAWGTLSNKMNSSEWDKVLKLADEVMFDIIQRLSNAAVPVPEVGYELVDSKGASKGEAELAWENTKIAFMLDYQIEESKDEFEGYGWSVTTLSDDVDTLINKLRG